MGKLNTYKTKNNKSIGGNSKFNQET